MVYSIEDEGDGYDYKTVIAKYMVGDVSYYHNAGMGTHSQARTKMLVTFNERGNAVHLMYLFEVIKQ